jgi:predicted XRE-type DNA-binding protein
MRKLRDVIVELTQVEAANLLGVAQPRVSDLKRLASPRRRAELRLALSRGSFAP